MSAAGLEPDAPQLDEWRDWPEERRATFAKVLADEAARRAKMWRCKTPGCNGEPHGTWFERHARWNQLPPPGDWFEWLVMAGRGFGKTRMGAQYVRDRAYNPKLGPGHRIALIGRTVSDVRDTMIEGESGLLSIFGRDDRPQYQPSKRRVVFANGAVAFCYSSDEPDQLRGPQHHTVWADELATFDNLAQVVTNYRLGLRLGRNPRAVLTTTPRRRPEIRALMTKPETVVTRGTTYENLANLAPAFAGTVLRNYEGTRVGRQELEGEYLDEVEGALWTLDLLDQNRVPDVRGIIRQMEIIVAVDPSGTKDGDECGIVVVGLLDQTASYVLADVSGQYHPWEWGALAVQTAQQWGAGVIVGETNFGAEMVEHTLNTCGLPPWIKYRKVSASKGKRVRAEPISSLYERGIVHHAGTFPALEDQLCTWVPSDRYSPGRLDAVVWALTFLHLRKRGLATVV